MQPLFVNMMMFSYFEQRFSVACKSIFCHSAFMYKHFGIRLMIIVTPSWCLLVGPNSMLRRTNQLRTFYKCVLGLKPLPDRFARREYTGTLSVCKDSPRMFPAVEFWKKLPDCFWGNEEGVTALANVEQCNKAGCRQLLRKIMQLLVGDTV